MGTLSRSVIPSFVDAVATGNSRKNRAAVRRISCIANCIPMQTVPVRQNIPNARMMELLRGPMPNGIIQRFILSVVANTKFAYQYVFRKSSFRL